MQYVTVCKNPLQWLDFEILLKLRLHVAEPKNRTLEYVWGAFPCYPLSNYLSIDPHVIWKWMVMLLIMWSHSLKTTVKTPSHSANRTEKKSKIVNQSQLKHYSGNSDLWLWGNMIVDCCLVANKMQCCTLPPVIFDLPTAKEFYPSHNDFINTDLKLIFYQFSDGAVRRRHCIPLQHTCSTGYNSGCGLFYFWWVKFIEIQTICPFYSLTDNKKLITLVTLSITCSLCSARCEALEASKWYNLYLLHLFISSIPA